MFYMWHCSCQLSYRCILQCDICDTSDVSVWIVSFGYDMSILVECVEWTLQLMELLNVNTSKTPTCERLSVATMSSRRQLSSLTLKHCHVLSLLLSCILTLLLVSLFCVCLDFCNAQSLCFYVWLGTITFIMYVCIYCECKLLGV